MHTHHWPPGEGRAIRRRQQNRRTGGEEGGDRARLRVHVEEGGGNGNKKKRRSVQGSFHTDTDFLEKAPRALVSDASLSDGGVQMVGADGRCSYLVDVDRRDGRSRY